MFAYRIEELTMSEPRTPGEGAPSPDAVKEHVKKFGEKTNLGAGNTEPDPATAEAPPDELKAGDKKRRTTGAGPDPTEAGVGGKD